MILDQLIENSSETNSLVERLDELLEGMNLSKDNLISHNSEQLKQSIVTINVLISKTQKEYLDRDNRGEATAINSFEISHIIRALIQRKSFILDRYKKISKKEIYDKMRLAISKIEESIEKEALNQYLSKLEYIDLNTQSIVGQIQNLTR